MVPAGLDQDEKAHLCGPVKPVQLMGVVDRFDSISYLSRLGIRPGRYLQARVGHSVSVEVAAWSREVLDLLASKDVAVQIDPTPILEEEAKGAANVEPSWDNSLVDLWDDEPVVHAVAAIKCGMHRQVAARVWGGQSSILLPFTYRVLRCMTARYTRELDRAIQWPLRKTFGSKEIVIESADKLEFSDLLYHARLAIPPAERDLVTVAAQVRHAIAHRDIVDAPMIALLSKHYEANRPILVADIGPSNSA